MRSVETSRQSVGRHGGTCIDIRSGREGPRHDPYQYNEITVTRSDGRSATVHTGLGDWMTFDDGRVKRKFDDLDYRHLREKFEACVGITPEVARRAFDAVRARRIKYHSCGYRHLHYVDGYPGETLLACEKCGEVLEGSFDLSAVQ